MLLYIFTIYKTIEKVYNTLTQPSTKAIAMNEENYTDEELEQMFKEREEAEASGIFDTIEEPGKALKLTEEQEYDLWMATSALSRLAKETNSSMSDLLKMVQQ
jgi:hypothetical protein